MNPQKLCVAILFSAVLLGGGACSKKANVTQTPVPSPIVSAASPEQYHQGDSGVLPVVQAKFFKGSIGSQLGLQMKLIRNGDQLSGNYSYQKVGTRIDLKGTIDKDNNVTLEEFDTGGKQTGLFKGTWMTDKDSSLANVAGNWSKPNSDKKTAFSLHEEPIEFSGGVELSAKRLKENNKKLNYQIDAEYPQATGAADPRFEKFNQEAKNVVARWISEFKKQTANVPKAETTETYGQPASEDKSSVPENTLEIGYDVAVAKDDLISIKFDLGSYSSGAAHPNSSSSVLNYDVKAGKVLKLADVFNPGVRYLQAISSYCIKDLKKQSQSKGSLLEGPFESGAGPVAKNYQSWNITRKGLEITFDAYQVGPYAAGPQTVIVPYSALKDLIKPDGALAQFVK